MVIQIYRDNRSEYINNELKDYFVTSGVIDVLIPPYSVESNGIVERLIQTINMIACSMTIAAPDLGCVWAKADNMATNLKTRVPHKYLPSSTTPFKYFYGKRPTILDLTQFRSKCYIHIRDEGNSSGSQHFSRSLKAIIVSYTPSSKVYRLFTFEDKYVFTT
jgi:hypothetical protein